MTDDRYWILDAGGKNGITLLRPGEMVASQMKKLFLVKGFNPSAIASGSAKTDINKIK
jgi:hypothetical protein